MSRRFARAEGLFRPLAVLVSMLVLLLATMPADAAVGAYRPAVATPAPRTPKHLPNAIEPLTHYTGQISCDPRVRPGTRRLAQLLTGTYRAYDATTWASAYACGTDSPRSEHYEGRAIDWMVDVHNRRQRTAARAAIRWLLATDSAGNVDAMARRLGVMYLIWNNRIWGAWDGTWESYNGCANRRSSADDNACHRTHVHISLSWDGAMGRTSFWTGRVPSVTDNGPCRAADLNWAPRYRHRNPDPCPQYPTVAPAKRASSTKKALVIYSGARVSRGSHGPVVSAVQRALRVPDTASYTSPTATAVRRFQASRHLARTGVMNTPTWRALLAAVR